jgi:DNA-binding MarR family transcriptional regulator
MSSVVPTASSTLGEAPRFVLEVIEPGTSAALASALLSLQSLRATMLGVRRINDAAWNMLLDLYVHGAQGPGVPVSSLGIASGAPQSTSLRLINQIEAQGLVYLQDDPLDGRRRMVRLTNEARTRLDKYLRSALDRLERLPDRH